MAIGTSLSISADIINAVNEIHKETLINASIFSPLTEKEVSQLVDLLDVNEKYIGFDKLAGELKKKGVKDANGAAAAIGMKKYGKGKFEKAAHSGKSLKEDLVPKIPTVPKINPTATATPPVSTTSTTPKPAVPKIAKVKTAPSPMHVNVGISKPTVSEDAVAVHEKFGIGKILPGLTDGSYEVMFEHGIEKVLESDLIILEKKDRREIRDNLAKEKNGDTPAFRRVIINKGVKKDDEGLKEDLGTADKKVVLAKSPTGKPIWRKIRTKQDISSGLDNNKNDALGESIVPHLLMQIKENMFETSAEIKFKSGESIIVEADDINTFIKKYTELNAVERAESQKFACESYDNFKEFIKQ